MTYAATTSVTSEQSRGEIDERNIDLARQRVGMFLNTPEPEKAA